MDPSPSAFSIIQRFNLSTRGFVQKISGYCKISPRTVEASRQRPAGRTRSVPSSAGIDANAGRCPTSSCWDRRCSGGRQDAGASGRRDADAPSVRFDPPVPFHRLDTALRLFVPKGRPEPVKRHPLASGVNPWWALPSQGTNRFPSGGRHAIAQGVSGVSRPLPLQSPQDGIRKAGARAVEGNAALRAPEERGGAPTQGSRPGLSHAALRAPEPCPPICRPEGLTAAESRNLPPLVNV